MSDLKMSNKPLATSKNNNGEAIIITSLQNSLVKEFVSLHQKKYRDESGLMLLEGEKALRCAQEAGLEILHILTPENAVEKVMEKISTTKSPPKIAAIAKKPQYKIEQFKKLNRIALFEGIKDAGNLGTIVRAACGLGIEGILLYGDCVDYYSPKVLRATAGNAFKIPVLEIQNVEEFKTRSEHNGENSFPHLQRATNENGEAITNSHALIAAVVKGGESFEKIEFKDSFIIMFGSEAEGLSEKLVNLADKKVTLDIENGVESLNLALCAGIFFYKVYEGIRHKDIAKT